MLPKCDASESACHTKFLDERECCAGAFIGFLIIGMAFLLDERFLTLSPKEVCLEIFPREYGRYK